MTIQLLHGDCRDVLPTLEAGSVQTCVTSPPYFGLRDYQTGTWEGGSAECGHAVQLGGNGNTSQKQVTSAGTQTYQYRDICGKCGARRIDRQIGMEQTLADYVRTLVDVFREVWRVLKDDGTLWVVLGDSYAMSTRGSSGRGKQATNHGSQLTDRHWQIPDGLKEKNLLGVPWRVAFALQDAGWILRSDIIWAKGNPMPESVKDRPTKAHEYLFLFAKQSKYYYDADAIREPQTGNTHSRGKGTGRKDSLPGSGIKSNTSFNRAMASYVEVPGGRNRRSVWTINTLGTPDAHFATFPEKLVEPCILAGSRAGDTVLDPFMGSGTTARVATRLQRHAIGIDLNESYIALQEKRTDGVQVAMIEVLS